MKHSSPFTTVYISFALFLFAIPAFAVDGGGIGVNEVMFNPVGDDTGNEWVEVFNASSETKEIGGWQLYPDGVGYFTFPANFRISSHSYVVIHLRSSGVNTDHDLYFPSATGNMGNSSGSLALFLPGEKSKDTLVSFMRYHKPGSSERKTWESAAGEAGLWTVGTYVDIATLSEGSSLGLASDGVTSGFSSAWRQFSSPSANSANGSGGAVSSSTASLDAEEPETASTSGNNFPTAPLYVVPHLDVSISVSPIATAAAPHRFEGRAYGVEKRPISGNARYLWNFGDGGIAEGALAVHTFRFPGTYTVSLNVNSSSAVGYAVSDIQVNKNAIRMSEVMVGARGFVEIQNSSGETLDIGGWILNDGESSFTIPLETKIHGHGVVAFPNEITKLLFGSSTEISLFYGNMETADRAPLLERVGVLATARNGEEWAVYSPTPGTTAVGEKRDGEQLLLNSIPATAIASEARKSEAVPRVIHKDKPRVGGASSSLAAAGTAGGTLASRTAFFFGLASIFGIGGGILLVFIRRKFFS